MSTVPGRSHSNPCSLNHGILQHKSMKKDQHVSLVEHRQNPADHLFQQACKLPDGQVYHRLPANNIDLILDERTIMAPALKAASKAYCSFNLLAYSLEKHPWTGAIIDSIWWKAYGKSFFLFNQPDELKIKNLLMINYELTRGQINSVKIIHVSVLCATLKWKIKNHVITCRTEKRQQIRSDWLNMVEEYLSNNHEPGQVKASIVRYMTYWLAPMEEVDSDRESQ
jgi:hypothetical protein